VLSPQFWGLFYTLLFFVLPTYGCFSFSSDMFFFSKPIPTSLSS